MSCCIPPKDSDPELRSFFTKEILKMFPNTHREILDALTLEGLRKLHSNRHHIKHNLNVIHGPLA